ncbi:putative ribonuclease H-like domain-containing protein [Tanacetum coccineum]
METFSSILEWYVVPTGRVVVPTGRYVVPAGKVIIIVSPGRLSLVPTGRVLSPEFKNAHIIELYGFKGIKRDYSNAKTPQQNRVAERKNRTLIEAARTMLADSKLPTMFWTEAVRTACYVLNRVVYNVPTKKVEEMMNLRYLEEKPNVQGLGREWYFELDYLTDSLGYKRDKANQSAGTHEASINLACIQDADSDSGDKVDDSTLDSAEENFQKELARLKGQEQRATSDAKDTEEFQERASTKSVPTGSIQIPSGETTISTGSVPVPTGSPTDSFFDDAPITRFPSPLDLGNNEPLLGIFSSSSYDDEFCADLNNLASTLEVSPVATKRINTYHPQSLIIGDHTSAVQTRSKINKTTTVTPLNWVAAE